jgi:hypothetical protein
MEEENKDICRIQMVNVSQLIDTLGLLFSKGIDYIDVYQDKKDENTIVFFFTKEYINENYRKNFEDEFIGKESNEPKNELSVKLTDEDINRLL